MRWIFEVTLSGSPDRIEAVEITREVIDPYKPEDLARSFSERGFSTGSTFFAGQTVRKISWRKVNES